MAGESARIRSVDDHVVVHQMMYKQADVIVIDAVLSVLQPFGITVFQRSKMQSQLTSLCMCLSKRSCSPPCGMSYLTCTYTAGGVSGTKADVQYIRKMFIHTTKEFFSLTIVPAYMCYAYFPIIENVFGKVDVVKMTKKLHSFFKMISFHK
jgi:hypothetical protein